MSSIIVSGPSLVPTRRRAIRRTARKLIASGHTNKIWRLRPDIPVNTVGTHRRAAFAKLDVQSRVQLTNALHASDLVLAK
jgi:DNA-binding CsgD family transcriptional regulator